MGLTVHSSQLTFCQVQSHMTQKTKTNIKNPARPNLDVVP